VSVGLFLVASPAHADRSGLPPEIGYNYGEIESARTAALGGADRALSSSVAALFVNPANVVASRVYHVGALAQIWPEARRQSYGAGAVDSVTNPAFSAGLGATYNLQDLDGVNRRSTDVRLAVGLPLSDVFSVGMGGHYLTLTQDGEGPLGPSRASGGLHGKNIVAGFTFDLGASIRPTQGLTISAVGTNLNDPGNGLQPLSASGGIGFANDRFSIEADALADFTTWDSTTLRAMGGAEVLLGDNYPLRAGYRYDQGAQTHALSIGAGYVDPKISLELGLRRTIIGPTVTTLVLGFTFHIEGTDFGRSSADGF
jgi:opacity protein-like surface antigen